MQPFEAEVGRVLDLVINSLYQHREIFLRELISNASDACDRLRYASLTEPGLLGDDPELKILIAPDKAAGTLTVRDNGIGMSRDELAGNLGTIARSGTQGFVSQLSGDAAKDVRLIGQFGVGFYSTFMVASEVEVISRRAGEEHGWRWRSDGRSGFTIEPEEEPAPRGTAVALKLRDDAKEFLDEYRLRQIVRSYSDHIAVPILLQTEPEKKDGEAKETQQINEASALWTRPKADISDEQYKEFYHHVAHAFDDPWVRLHVQAEGVVSYQALLFVPSTPPFDLYDPQRQHGIKLYVRRVFITGDLEGLMPRYLRFVKGVVDSEDLQLNVSRETLQHSPVLAKIRRDLVKRLLDELDRRAKADPADYEKFWGSFGAVLKEGMYEDHEQRERLLELARFHSTASDGLVSLADYLGRLKSGQDAIYTISGESPAALKASPQLEACRAKGIEVLLLSDPIDEFWMPVVHDYKGKPFRSLTRGDVDLSKIESAQDGPEEAEIEGDALDRLIAVFKARLGDKVQDVRRSSRLTESAVCLVAEEHGMDLRLERFLKQQQQLHQLSKRILEINPKHGLIREMARAAADAGQQEMLGDLAELLLDQARIVEGEPVPDPGAFSRRMSAFLTRGLAA
ncbi:MAG TPA: molecular chaperone HtpG [Geminicoccaceae bacterium]|nr:molecular chaperone HtpG [Geminicoccaceae bacterium]